MLLQAGPTWHQVGAKAVRTGRTISQELVLLVKDCNKAIQAARQWYTWVVSELSRPIMKR